MANSVFCKNCGASITDGDHTESKPCPRCGSFVRSLELQVSSGHYAIEGAGLSASTKTNLSGYFASSSALFSRKAHALEALKPTAVNEIVRMEHRSYVIGAVIGAASYLEAATNELYLEGCGSQSEHLPLQSVCAWLN